MHIKTKSLLVFCLTMFVSFSAFGSIAESFTKWKACQVQKIEQALDELRKEGSSSLENSEDKIKVYKFDSNLNFQDSIHKNLIKFACRNIFYFNNSINNMIRQLENEPHSPIIKALIKNHIIGIAVGAVFGIAKKRFSYALVASVLTTCLGLSLFREGDIRIAMNPLFVHVPLPYGKYEFDDELKLINSIMGCEFDLPIESDGRSYLSMHPVFVKELMENAEPNQKCIALRIIDRINPFKKNDATSEYNQLQNILNENKDSDAIQIPKKLLPYLYSNTYEEGANFYYLIFNCPKPKTLYLYTMNSKIKLYACDNSCGGMYDFFELLNYLRNALSSGRAKIQYDADGTPRIYRKDQAGNLVQDDKAMKLCGLHGISYSSIQKEKQEQQANSNSYSSVLKEQREQEAAA